MKLHKIKKRILIVNCYFDDMRLPVGRKSKAPQAMGPAYLAGAFSVRACDVRLYSEMYSGPLEDENLLSWPDMLVMTGLNTAFDRMLHITAYARSKNARVIVVAGGPVVRALPILSRRYFDYACLGDVEEMRDVIEDAFGKEHVAPNMTPRFDLAYWMWAGLYGYVESSRYCNFKCPYCSLTTENQLYQKYDLEFISRQIKALGKRKKRIAFIDNNFYGNDRQFFLDRLDLLKELRAEEYLDNWSALVTTDFFYNQKNLKLAKEAGCVTLFTGLESFDLEWLNGMNKTQNSRLSPVDLISRCISEGIVFLYGLMFDVTQRTIADLRKELQFILDTPEIPLPCYLSVIVPILGTSYFYRCLEEGVILPSTKLRDLDTTTLSVKPLDPMDEVAAFIYEIQTLYGYKKRALKHSRGFYRRYRSVLSSYQMGLELINAAILSFQTYPSLSMNLNSFRGRNRNRTHVSTTEPPDRVYRPAFTVDSKFEAYFRPTYLTDVAGSITPELEEDIYNGRMSGLSHAAVA